MKNKPRTAEGSRGGAAPGIAGGGLVREITLAIGSLDGVTVTRNPVMRVSLPSGGYAWTGVGGKGAPDLHVEVMTPYGITACLWIECKEGSGELSEDQRKWHEAAKKTGRHVCVARSVGDALSEIEKLLLGRVGGNLKEAAP